MGPSAFLMSALESLSFRIPREFAWCASMGPRFDERGKWRWRLRFRTG